MMRDPAEIAEEERLKQLEKEKIRAQKTALSALLWEACLQYFRFSDLVKISQFYWSRCADEAVFVKTEKIDAILDSIGHPALDVTISRDGAFAVANVWIQSRYGDRRSASNMPTNVDQKAAQIVNGTGFSIEQERWALPNVVAFTKANQEVFLERDSMAGFNARDVDMFRDSFDRHKGSSPELKPAQLWGLLEELSLRFPEKEDQARVIQILNEVDLNKNGMLAMEELLHLVRRILDENKIPQREREHRLLAISGMDLADIEDWYNIFQDACGDGSSISIANVKEVFESIEIKWDTAGSKQMKDWIMSVDEDYNGEIDFGEFCCLVQLMWEANFCNIRSVKVGSSSK